MKKTIAALSIVLLVIACQKFAMPDTGPQISAHDDDDSHNNGKNCMDCHYSAGWAEGVFTVGGTVYGNFQNADVELYKNPGEAPVLTVQVDQLGNLYTTESIDFEGGLYVGVRNAAGQLELMDGKIFHGQCNLCHGAGVDDRIEVD